MYLWPLVGTLLQLVVVLCETDYYKILGVEKDADDRTIRKAFKKLAIKMHPDKNKVILHNHITKDYNI